MASSPEFDPALADEDVRWPLVAKLGVGLAVLTLVGGLGAALVAAFVIDRSPEPEPIVRDAVDPVAPVALPDGGFLYGERTTGQIWRAEDGGASRSGLGSVVLSEFARIDDLAVDGQRGLLGLAVRGRLAGDDDVYASWTRASDGRLVVGRVIGDEPGLVWEGPVSTDVANGGTLAFRGGELLIGVGELQDPEAVDDPASPNGKILALDPDGVPDQEPTVVASGFHNPFALTVVAGEVWVADNAPGDAAETLWRIRTDGDAQTLELDGKRAPSGLAVTSGPELLLCGFVSQRVERIAVPDTGITAPAGGVDDLPCATGVAVLADGSIVAATVDALWRAG